MAARASKDLEALRLRAHAHTLGYTGQFSSKSLHFSTTFGALRLARAHFAKSEDDGQPDYDGEWRFAGRGYLHPEADELAATLLDAVPRGSRWCPDEFLKEFPPAMTRDDAGKEFPDRELDRDGFRERDREPAVAR